MINNKRIDWGFLLLFLIFPLYSIPNVLKRAARCDKAGIISLCLFFCILAFLIVPNYDATNHGHWAFNTFQNGMFWKYNSELNDFYLPYLEYVVLSLGLQYHYVIFITVLFAALPFWMMFYEVANNESPVNKKRLFIIFLLLFPFISVMCGLRYFTAVSWLIYSSYQLLYARNIKKSIIFLFIVLSIHFSIVVQVIILIFAYLTKVRCNRNITVIFVISLCVLSVVIVNSLLPYLYMYFASEKVDMYADTEYMDVLEGQNVNFYISYWTKYLTWIPLTLIASFIYYEKIRTFKMFPMFWFSLMLWAIGFGFTTLEYRWGILASNFFFLCIFIEGIKNSWFPIKFYKIFVFAHTCRYILMVYGMKSYLRISDHLVYLLFLPYPILLCLPYEQNVYNYIWEHFIRH